MIDNYNPEDFERLKQEVETLVGRSVKTPKDFEFLSRQIESEKEALQNALDNNEISFDDFQKAKKELDDFAEEVKEKKKQLLNL